MTHHRLDAQAALRSPLMSSSVSAVARVASPDWRLSSLVGLALWPTLLFVVLFVLLHVAGGDLRVADWFYDPQSDGFPLRHNVWLDAVLHDGARQALSSVAFGLLLAWLASWRIARLRVYRRDLALVLVAIVLSLLSVHLLKDLTNVDCPWDWQGYGGDMPVLSLFDAKPAGLERGLCFPGGHSSGGFALLVLFFVGRERRLWKLAPGLATGSVFALDQWARGAHVPSHDLTSAWLCWMVALATYALFTRASQRRPALSSPAA